MASSRAPRPKRPTCSAPSQSARGTRSRSRRTGSGWPRSAPKGTVLPNLVHVADVDRHHRRTYSRSEGERWSTRRAARLGHGGPSSGGSGWRPRRRGRRSGSALRRCPPRAGSASPLGCRTARLESSGASRRAASTSTGADRGGGWRTRAIQAVQARRRKGAGAAAQGGAPHGGRDRPRAVGERAVGLCVGGSEPSGRIVRPADAACPAAGPGWSTTRARSTAFHMTPVSRRSADRPLWQRTQYSWRGLPRVRRGYGGGGSHRGERGRDGLLTPGACRERRHAARREESSSHGLVPLYPGGENPDKAGQTARKPRLHVPRGARRGPRPSARVRRSRTPVSPGGRSPRPTCRSSSSCLWPRWPHGGARAGTVPRSRGLVNPSCRLREPACRRHVPRRGVAPPISPIGTSIRHLGTWSPRCAPDLV